MSDRILVMRDGLAGRRIRRAPKRPRNGLSRWRRGRAMMSEATTRRREPLRLRRTRRSAITASISRCSSSIAYFSIRVPEFRTWDNALLILLQVSVIGIIAVGMTFTIITAGIDLSVGSLLAVAGIFSGAVRAEGPDRLSTSRSPSRCRSSSASSAARSTARSSPAPGSIR